jgi:hypothetical protein
MDAAASLRLAIVFVLAVAGSACGGRVGGDAADGGGDSRSTSSNGTDGGSSQSPASDAGFVFGVCPAVPPGAGDACAQTNQGCAYVTNGSCVAFVCEGSGHWQSTTDGC